VDFPAFIALSVEARKVYASHISMALYQREEAIKLERALTQRAVAGGDAWTLSHACAKEDFKELGATVGGWKNFTCAAKGHQMVETHAHNLQRKHCPSRFISEGEAPCLCSPDPERKCIRVCKKKIAF